MWGISKLGISNFGNSKGADELYGLAFGFGEVVWVSVMTVGVLYLGGIPASGDLPPPVRAYSASVNVGHVRPFRLSSSYIIAISVHCNKNYCIAQIRCVSSTGGPFRCGWRNRRPSACKIKVIRALPGPRQCSAWTHPRA